MRKEMHLHWFSGSGNTLRAAETFAERLRELRWTVRLRPIERRPGENDVDGMFDPAAVFGLAFPTHCFSVPEIIRSFVRRLPPVSGTPAVMLGTHGAFSGGVLGPMRRMLQNKGFRCVAGRILTMPDSFFPFFGGETNRKQITRTLGQTRRYADRCDELFESKKEEWPRLPLFSDLHGFFLGSFFASRKYLPAFHSTIHARPDLCTRCDTCIRFCPVGALKRESPQDVPKPDRRCTNCLRCVAVCHVDAMRHLIGFHPYRGEEVFELRQRLKRELDPS